MSVSSLVYASSSRLGPEPFRRAGLQAILDASRRRNASVGVGGVLMHGDGGFVQLLEGPKEAVEACYSDILRDPRHADVELLARSDAAGRRFAGWHMAYVGFDEEPRLTGAVDLRRLRRGRPGASEAIETLLRIARAKLD